MKFSCLAGRSVKPFPLYSSTEPERSRESSGKLVLESLVPEPFWHHHWWLRYFKGIQLNLGSMNTKGHNWQPAVFDPHTLLSCVPVGQSVPPALCPEETQLCHTSPALPLGSRAAPGAQDPAEKGQLHPRNGSKSAFNSSGFTWCNWSLILALSIVCWLHFDVMNASYFSCFDNKSGAWLQRKSGLEHPVASQRQMCYQYRHLFLMIDLRHNSPSKTKGMDVLWMKIWHVSMHSRNKGKRFMQMSWIVDGSHPGEIPSGYFKYNNNWH